MKRILFSTAILFSMILLNGSCTTKEKLVEEDLLDKGEIWSITVEAEKADNSTKAIFLDEGGALQTKWVEGEEIIVFTENGGKWTKVGVLTPSPKANKPSRAVLSGTFTKTDNIIVGTTLNLLYPRDTFFFVEQKGTIEEISNKFDFSYAQVHVSELNTTTKSITTDAAIFENQQSVFRITLTDGTNPVEAKVLKVTTQNDSLVCGLDYSENYKAFGAITVRPETATSELYVSMRNESKRSDVYKFTVVDSDGIPYTATKSGNLKIGKFYNTTLTLTRQSYFQVEAKESVTTASWTNYTANTINCISGFTPTADPSKGTYLGWRVTPTAASGSTDLGTSGFFRIRKGSDRWWFLDPNNYAFLSKAVCLFTAGDSERQIANRTSRYGDLKAWAKAVKPLLQDIGINSFGAWSDITRAQLSPAFPYTVIISPMDSYNKYLKSSGTEAAAYAGARSWEGYPYDFAMVFDEKFDEYVDAAVAVAANHKDNKRLIGYFLDNELPWKDYALENCLTKWPSTHINNQKAQLWLDERKGRSGCTMDDVTQDDKDAFIAYCYEVYLQKVVTKLKVKDPNHLILGSRFNAWNYELQNEYMFSVAGAYCDVISINHYHRWQPDQTVMNNWAVWSGKPFLITEFYVKGADSGLKNTTGAGFLVKSQYDRGLFYQNFVIELLKNKNCVGWQWFSYMDNDPTSPSSDASNIDSNKGIVKWNNDPYYDLTDMMKEINNSTYRLAKFFNP